jgi:serine/threonine protein phosphatase PrpC
MTTLNSNLHILSLSIEVSTGKGEDKDLVYDDNSEFITMAVFDGLGGRSAGFDGMTGGQVASSEASIICKQILKQWNPVLTQDTAIDIQQRICQSLRSLVESKMSKSRLSGTLTGKRLCTTIALASVAKEIDPNNNSCEVKLAWMGDSRIYFLSPNHGLQQLTVDDLEVDKDAFQMIREDPPMSQYLTADIPTKWQIHFVEEKLEERGCILVCTDGCFQYLPSPWDFENLLLQTLHDSQTISAWQELLAQRYQEIKQDDISLILYPIGFSSFEDLKQSYQPRLQNLIQEYNPKISSVSSYELWQKYRIDYEIKLKLIASRLRKNLEDSITVSVDNDSLDNADIKLLGSELQQSLLPNVISEEQISKSNILEPETTSNQIDKLYQEAIQHRNNGDVQKAVKLYQDILEKEPHNPKAHFELGYIYFSREENKYLYWAINHFKNVINILESRNEEKKLDYKTSLLLIARALFQIAKHDSQGTQERQNRYKASIDYFSQYSNRHLRNSTIL